MKDNEQLKAQLDRLDESFVELRTTIASESSSIADLESSMTDVLVQLRLLDQRVNMIADYNDDMIAVTSQVTGSADRTLEVANAVLQSSDSMFTAYSLVIGGVVAAIALAIQMLFVNIKKKATVKALEDLASTDSVQTILVDKLISDPDFAQKVFLRAKSKAEDELSEIHKPSGDGYDEF